MHSAETIVVGGGSFGAAVAYGLARNGVDTMVLDGSDGSLRAARGNFGLVWVQTKGLGLQRYADWSRESAHLWKDFAGDLQDSANIDVNHQNEGGLNLLLSDEERENCRRTIDMMRQQAGPDGYDAEIIDRNEVQKMVPSLRVGEGVVGASFGPHDGHVNPLKLLRALHRGFERLGGRYFPCNEVARISHDGGAFVAETAADRFTAPKIVIACGHGITKLAPMVGLNAPIRPQRGQVLVTERIEATVAMAIGSIRQTDEGGFMFGNSEEEVGFDDGTTLPVTRNIAARAVKAFPQMSNVRLVRNWGCIRVLTPDKCAIYEESETMPGAYVATSHSGVTLAAVNAHHVSRWVSSGETPPDFDHFSARRFDVPAAA
jgi:glycine/D-amino acid oxidase-like deaminating enzyme